ncbi:MAG: response regulator [Balneolaceae bacterium]
MSTINSVCIIDDDKIYTYGISKIIKTYLPGKKLISFENGLKALEGIKQMADNNEELPDLILLDIDMPEMNGWDFLHAFEKIRNSIEKEIQVFVISSRVDNDNQELYKIEWNKKVSDFIQKPVDIETLRNLLS